MSVYWQVWYVLDFVGQLPLGNGTYERLHCTPCTLCCPLWRACHLICNTASIQHGCIITFKATSARLPVQAISRCPCWCLYRFHGPAAQFCVWAASLYLPCILIQCINRKPLHRAYSRLPGTFCHFIKYVTEYIYGFLPCYWVFKIIL